jgi:hypothetical protein
MNVRELLIALRDVSPDATVRVTYGDEDDRFAHCVTLARDGIRICDNHDGVSSFEKIIHDDLTADDGQFGVGAE